VASIPCGRATLGEGAPAGTGALRAEPVVELAAVDDQPLGYLRLWDGHLGLTPDFKSIAVCDLSAGRPTTVAALDEGSPASLDWVDGAGDTVVHSRLASVPDLSSPEPKAEWTIEATDLGSGTRRRLAQSGGKGGPETNYHVLPRPVVDGHWVVWVGVPGPADQGGELVVFDLRTGRRRVVARRVFPGEVGLWKGMVAYDDVSDRGRDIFVVPADGSAGPRRLTQVGTVTYPRFANGWAAWQEVVEAIRDTPQGYRTDLDPVWAVSLAGGEPVRMERGRHPVPGDGFVLAEVVNRGLVLYDTRAPTAPPVVVAGPDEFDVAARWDVLDGTAAWATPDYGIRLVRVER
jgi:hypothetical protein